MLKAELNSKKRQLGIQKPHCYDAVVSTVIRDFKQRKPFVKDPNGDYQFNAAFWADSGLLDPEREYRDVRPLNKTTAELHAYFSQYVDAVCVALARKDYNKSLSMVMRSYDKDDSGSNFGLDNAAVHIVPSQMREFVRERIKFEALNQKLEQEIQGKEESLRLASAKNEKLLDESNRELRGVRKQLGESEEMHKSDVTKYRSKIAELKAAESSRDAEISQLKMQLRDAQERLQKYAEWARQRQEYDQKYYQHQRSSLDAKPAVAAASGKQASAATSPTNTEPANRHHRSIVPDTVERQGRPPSRRMEGAETIAEGDDDDDDEYEDPFMQ